MRKAEVSVPSGQKWGKIHLSRASVIFKINGVCYEDPTREQLLSMREGDFVILTPPPSKADQFGAVWGSSPIWLEYIPMIGNAAQALVNMEVNFPCKAARRETPMFTVDGKPMGHSRLDKLLKDVLCTFMSPAMAETHSYHSFRITLACQLLAAGASDGRIQAICRWQTTKSLWYYARLNNTEYAEWLRRAATVDITSVRSQNLQVELCDSGCMSRLDSTDMTASAQAAELAELDVVAVHGVFLD
jgi:hypothetical protein